MIDISENDFGVMLRPVLGEEDDDDTYLGNVEVAVFSNLMPDVDICSLHIRWQQCCRSVQITLSLTRCWMITPVQW